MIGPQDVKAAAALLDGVITRTPVQRSRVLSELVGTDVWLKCENLQRAGSFKIRGAYTRISRLSDEEKARGVVAASAGNHAQGVALAGQLLGIDVKVYMPHGAPMPKLLATQAYGATIEQVGTTIDECLVKAREWEAETGAVLIHPFDHRDIVAGQGTAGLEILDQCPDVKTSVVSTGGGGLLAGSLLAAEALAPQCRVVGVEPAAGNDGQQSVKAGHVVQIPTPHTIADGAQTQALGQLTFPIIQRLADEMVTATDEQLMEALRFFAERMKLVVEPTGALAFAGAQHGSVDVHGARVGILISGGNVDLARYARFLAD